MKKRKQLTPNQRVARFLKRNGVLGKAIFRALNHVDFLDLKPGTSRFGVPRDEYLSYAERFMDFWKKRPNKFHSEQEVALRVFRCFDPEMYLGIHRKSTTTYAPHLVRSTLALVYADHPDIIIEDIRAIARETWNYLKAH